MVRPGMRHVVGALAGLDLVMGLLLLQHAWDRSWFTWSPPYSAVWYTEFRPYVTFYPGLLLTVLGVVTAAGLVADMGRRPVNHGLLLTACAWTHFAMGGGMLVATFAFLSFYMACSDPGGCRDVFDPYPPVAVPAGILFKAGACGSVFDFVNRRRSGRMAASTPAEP